MQGATLTVQIAVVRRESKICPKWNCSQCPDLRVKISFKHKEEFSDSTSYLTYLSQNLPIPESNNLKVGLKHRMWNTGILCFPFTVGETMLWLLHTGLKGFSSCKTRLTTMTKLVCGLIQINYLELQTSYVQLAPIWQHLSEAALKSLEERKKNFIHSEISSRDCTSEYWKSISSMIASTKLSLK